MLQLTCICTTYQRRDGQHYLRYRLRRDGKELLREEPLSVFLSSRMPVYAYETLLLENWWRLLSVPASVMPKITRRHHIQCTTSWCPGGTYVTRDMPNSHYCDACGIKLSANPEVLLGYIGRVDKPR